MRSLAIAFLLAMIVAPGAAAAAPVPLACVQGQPTWLSGSGPARAPILLYWAGRPVGGGSVDRSGHWALPLIVGQERPGIYPVEVRSRDDRSLIGAFDCAVGVVSPAAAPIAPAPTAAPAAQNFDRNGDGSVTCDDFATQAEAREALAAGYTDLDNDGDGIPCESLPK